MSEELKQKGLTHSGIRVGGIFEYFNIWNTTLSELAKYKIIPNRNYGNYSKKRPDGVLVDRSNPDNPKVVAIVEYKDYKKFKNNKDVLEAIRQCNDYAHVTGAIFGVATDTNVSYWINPHEPSLENEYVNDFWNKLSYSFIKTEDKQELSTNFILQKESQPDEEKLDDDTRNTLKVIHRILKAGIWKDNSELCDTKDVDPTPLARSVWQDIYVATGKEPEKCLYNVVELFIFKFLSDLGVLKQDRAFGHLVEMLNGGYSEKDVLEHYASKCRKKIRELFPPSKDDGTTVINGTIFVNEDGEPVSENATLFKKSILKYYEFGDLTSVDKSFKTKLYETFLKRDSWVKWMGQFFTPRKVVQAIVDMAKVENLPTGASVCDPFCGVWGFPLEVIAKRNNRDYEIKEWKIVRKIRYFGFDKWSNEKDSERTIILAKANMLIYLASLIRDRSSITEEFSEVFNDTFRLKKWTLGTLGDVSEDVDDLYDLILTNPPYVTAWSSILKEEIRNNWKYSDFYKVNGAGIESLAIEWIIRKLRKWWKAFVILPDWILSRRADKKTREFILANCLIKGIISLPPKTFFTTNQKTYILIIEKKTEPVKQSTPVFTYFVSNIGEELDVNRFDKPGSDLEKAKKQFRMFDWNEADFESGDVRCRIESIDRFYEKIDTWVLEKWLSGEERIILGLEKTNKTVSFKEFKDISVELLKRFDHEKKYLSEIDDVEARFSEFPIDTIFDVKKGLSRYTKTYIHKNKWDFPVYSSKTSDNGMIGSISTYDFDTECLTWTTDWTYVGTVFHRNGKFSMTTHCGGLFPKLGLPGKIYLPYIRLVLNKELPKHKEWEGSNKRLWTTKIWSIKVRMPILPDGSWDFKKQVKIAEYFEAVNSFKKQAGLLLADFMELEVEF